MLSEKNEKYFEDFSKEVKKVYAVAETARKRGLDPVSKVEIPLAMTMAAKVVGLIGTIYPQLIDSGVDKRILELEKDYGKLDPTVVFKIAEEVAKQKFCKFSSVLEAIDAGIRVGFAYTTLAVVSSPIEGFTGIKLRKTKDGKEYIEANFAGPIRSAGTTAGCIVLMLIDHLREMFGYAKYDPTENEVKRAVTELNDFHDRITNLQYMPTEDEIIFLAKNLPIQISGDASEKLEVSNYKNLDRVDTDYLRSGFCLIFAEALAQKAAKGFRLLNRAKENGVKSTGFDFLKEYIELHEARGKGKKSSKGERPTYIKDLVAGRPVFGHPSESGAFRFRYGRGRTSGFSAASVHPATMSISDNFIASGTQLKIEKPTKGCAITSCDLIDGPIVKLKDGNVKQIRTKEEGEEIYSEVEEIIYFGDILFPFSDVVNRNYDLLKPGYVEEWWELELREKTKEKIDSYNLEIDKVIEMSKKYGVPFYPKFIFYWNQINKEQFFKMLEWLKQSKVSEGKIIFPFSKSQKEDFAIGKRALELLGVEHEVTIENVVVSKKLSKAFFVNLGMALKLLEGGEAFLKDKIDLEKIQKIFQDKEKENEEKEGAIILKVVNELSEFEIKDKAGDFVGTRMGRPEKGKLRKLTGSPNVLFSVANQGGRLRSLNAALEKGFIKSEFPSFYCSECKQETIFNKCEDCGKETEKMFYCRDCKDKILGKQCPTHEKGTSYSWQSIDIKKYFDKAMKRLNMNRNEIPELIKAIRGTTSEERTFESLEKGILRAKFNLQVNKDGTVRFDATELPISHFKPKEISVSVEKLKELGYEKDIHGKELENEDQVLELMPHDILLPCCPESEDEKADDVFVKVSHFIDELLERHYGMEKFYNVKTREDLVGKLGVCMAPHNCAGVICRIIGFSKSQGLYASPYMHAAIRRDCDGDEAAVMLLMDVLLNFSRKFLPGHRGGTQDAPLVLNGKIDPGEVDDQILDLEMLEEYPLEFYKFAEQRKHSSEISSELVPTVKSMLKEGKDTFVNIGFTHDTSDINKGVLCSSYKKLGTMQEKVEHQMKLVEKIRAVDTPDVARLIIERHFIRDMRGNLRKFSMQGFRCVDCNLIMRRPPLKGICPKCGGKIIFTIHEGGIKKYLDPAVELTKNYDLSPYLKQTIELVKGYIESIFGKELEKQESLGQWF